MEPQTEPLTPDSERARLEAKVPELKLMPSLQNLHFIQGTLAKSFSTLDLLRKTQIEDLIRIEQTKEETPTFRKLRILSIDGGGIRGLIPASYLCELEKKIQEKTKNPKARLCDYFDMMCGTSTGGILVLCYLTPQEENRPMTSEEAMDIYLKQNHRVFQSSLARRITTGYGYFGCKYDHSGLSDLLREKVGEKRLSQLLKPAFITSFDGSRYHPFVFDSIRSRAMGDSHDYFLSDIGRATSAAPTYFEPHNMKSVNSFMVHERMIDGGVFANNASAIALSAAGTLSFGAKRIPRVNDIFLLSLGTGKVTSDLERTPEGIIQWAAPVIDITFASGSDVADYQVRSTFNSYSAGENYIRIQPSLRGCAPALDDISAENLEALRDLGRKIALEGIREPEKVEGYPCCHNSNWTVDDIADFLIKHDEVIDKVIPIETLKSNNASIDYKPVPDPIYTYF